MFNNSWNCAARSFHTPATAPPTNTSCSLQGDTIRVRQAGKTLTVLLACSLNGPRPIRTAGPHVFAAAPTHWPRGKPQHQNHRSLRPLSCRDFSETIINLALVEAGLAFAYRQYLSGCDAKAYLEAEERASRVRLGVWQVKGGITRPWDFRRARRSAVIPDGTTPGTAIEMAMAMEKPANPCVDRHLLPYRVAALLVATETSRSNGSSADVVD